jgi:5'-nucleotidase
METIHIYHTNDIHSHLERWPRIQQLLANQKEEHLKAGSEVFLFDIGDFVDRWHPFTEGTKGKGNTRLLNESGYTAITIGNNEGINFSYEDLSLLYEDADFDVLVANLYNKEAIHPEWVKEYRIYHTGQGTRIGVIGLTAYFHHIYNLLGWNLSKPMEELKKRIEIVKKQSDIIILLSHLGIQDDEKIAELFPEIDVILGGHTHHILPEGKQINQTILAAAGKYGHYVGQVTIQINDQKTVTEKTAILFDVDMLSPIIGEKEKVEFFYEKGKKLLNQRVANLQRELQCDPFHETNLSRLLCSALREWCAADCAIINAGLLLGPLSGEVTNFDLLKICPHPINPCKVELTGRQLKEVILQTKDPKWPHMEIKGLGFRGTVMGVFIFDGICFNDDSRPLLINGEEINLEKFYSLAIPDMFSFGRFFTEIYDCKHKEYYLPEFLRDLLKWKLQTE